ncbi:hypothetical protein PAXRUDRAFT_834050, partial [Paxillus rubicundulus Ve08.2h10]
MSRIHSCLQACSGTTASREAAGETLDQLAFGMTASMYTGNNSPINTLSHSSLSPSTPVPSSPVLSQLDNSPSKRCVQWPP